MFKIGDRVRIIRGSTNSRPTPPSLIGWVGRITGVWIDLHGKPTTDVPYPWKLEVSGIVVSEWFATSELELVGPNLTPTPAITLIEAENVELKKQLDYYKSNRDWWIQIYMKAQRLNGTLAVKNAENDNLRHLLSEKNQLIEAMGASRVKLEEELAAVKRDRALDRMESDAVMMYNAVEWKRIAEKNKLAWDQTFNEAMSNNEAYLKEKQRADTLQKDADRWQYARQFVTVNDLNKWKQRPLNYIAQESYSGMIDQCVDFDMSM